MRTATLVIGLMIVTASSAAAKDRCRESEPFTIARAQTLSGELDDWVGAVIPYRKFELLRNGKAVKKLKTDSAGKYDFGMVEPGTYQIRIDTLQGTQCVPKVSCHQDGCNIDRTVPLNPRRPVESR